MYRVLVDDNHHTVCLGKRHLWPLGGFSTGEEAFAAAAALIDGFFRTQLEHSLSLRAYTGPQLAAELLRRYLCGGGSPLIFGDAGDPKIEFPIVEYVKRRVLEFANALPLETMRELAGGCVH